jgi:hypothetical protein
MDARYSVTYNGNDVVRVGKAGLFQNGTTTWLGEEDARAAAAIPGFVVEGLPGAAPAKPAPAPAPAAAAPAKEEKKDAKAEKAEAKKEDKKEEKKAEAKAEAAAPAAEAKS